jgi:hypothetical protein
MENPLGTGVFNDISAEAYHADTFALAPSLSSSVARLLISQSPLHAWTAHPRLNPNHEPQDKKTFDIGRAAHTAVLGRGANYIAIPDDLLASNGAASTKAAKDFIEEARSAGLTPLKAAEVDQIAAMRSKIAERLDQLDIRFAPDRSEIVAVADIDGALCRAMVDNAPEAERLPLYDFKTTTDASPDAVMRAVMNYGYDVQAAHYLDTWKAATGEDRLFRFVFQEKTAPFEVSVVELGPDSLTMARKRIARAREIWRLCLDADSWPGYPTGVHRVELPDWYQSRWLERESQEMDFKNRTGSDVIAAAMRWQSPDPFEPKEK